MSIEKAIEYIKTKGACPYCIGHTTEFLERKPCEFCNNTRLEKDAQEAIAELKKKDELLFAYESVNAPVNPFIAENQKLLEIIKLTYDIYFESPEPITFKKKWGFYPSKADQELRKKIDSLGIVK